MLLSKCEVCDSKKLKIIKEKKPSGLLSSLGIKTPLSEIHLLVKFFFIQEVLTKKEVLYKDIKVV